MKYNPLLNLKVLKVFVGYFDFSSSKLLNRLRTPLIRKPKECNVIEKNWEIKIDRLIEINR